VVVKEEPKKEPSPPPKVKKPIPPVVVQEKPKKEVTPPKFVKPKNATAPKSNIPPPPPPKGKGEQ